jgi:hypothetical protein
MTARIMTFSEEKEVTLERRAAAYTDLEQKLALSITPEPGLICVQSLPVFDFEYV